MPIRLILSLGNPTSRAPTSIVNTSRRSGCTFRRASLISRLDSVTHDLYPRRHPRCFTRSVEHSIEYRLFLLSALNLFSRAHWRKPMPSDDVRFFPPTAHILKRHEPSAKCQRRHRAAPKSRTRLNLMFLVRCPALSRKGAHGRSSILPSTSGCAWIAPVWGISICVFWEIVALGAALGGCASSSEDIMPAYVSPVAYQGYTCQQLALEAQAISTRAATLSGAQDSRAPKTNGRLRLQSSFSGPRLSLSPATSRRPPNLLR